VWGGREWCPEGREAARTTAAAGCRHRQHTPPAWQMAPKGSGRKQNKAGTGVVRGEWEARGAGGVPPSAGCSLFGRRRRLPLSPPRTDTLAEGAVGSAGMPH